MSFPTGTMAIKIIITEPIKSAVYYKENVVDMIFTDSEFSIK